MGTEKRAITDFEDWMTNVQRRATQQERRVVPTSASDLLGPGFGPTGTQILDWNEEEPSFNGFFWSPVGAINSPNSELEWAGVTIAKDERIGGIQKVWSVSAGDPPQEYTRRFVDPGGASTRSYTPWRLTSTPLPDAWVTLGDPANGFTAAAAPYVPQVAVRNGFVVFRGAYVNTTFASTSLTPVVTLPVGIPVPPDNIPWYDAIPGTSTAIRYAQVDPATRQLLIANSSATATGSFYRLNAIRYPIN